MAQSKILWSLRSRTGEVTECRMVPALTGEYHLVLSKLVEGITLPPSEFPTEADALDAATLMVTAMKSDGWRYST